MGSYQRQLHGDTLGSSGMHYDMSPLSGGSSSSHGLHQRQGSGLSATYPHDIQTVYDTINPFIMDSNNSGSTQPFYNRAQIDRILGSASAEDLINAKNGAYLAMIMRNNVQEAEIRTSKEAFTLLLDRVNTAPAASDSHNGLSIHPILNNPSPDREQYPNVPYWTRKQWDKASSSRGPGFMTNVDGVPSTADEISAVRRTARSLWRKIADVRCAPETWGQINHTAANYYRSNMYHAHPDLRLCEGHWKVDLLATEEYPYWYRNNKHTCKDVKHEPAAENIKLEPAVDVTTNDTLTSVQKPNQHTKRTKTSKADKSERPRKKNKHAHNSVHPSQPSSGSGLLVADDAAPLTDMQTDITPASTSTDHSLSHATHPISSHSASETPASGLSITKEATQSPVVVGMNASLPSQNPTAISDLSNHADSPRLFTSNSSSSSTSTSILPCETASDTQARSPTSVGPNSAGPLPSSNEASADRHASPIDSSIDQAVLRSVPCTNSVSPDSGPADRAKQSVPISKSPEPIQLPKTVVVNPFASTMRSGPTATVTANSTKFLPEAKPKTKKPDADQAPHRTNKTSNGPKNLFAIDYVRKHPGASKAAVTQAYNALIPEHKEVYVKLGASNNVNKRQPNMAGTTTLD